MITNSNKETSWARYCCNTGRVAQYVLQYRFGGFCIAWAHIAGLIYQVSVERVWDKHIHWSLSILLVASPWNVTARRCSEADIVFCVLGRIGCLEVQCLPSRECAAACLHMSWALVYHDLVSCAWCDAKSGYSSKPRWKTSQTIFCDSAW